MSDQSKGEALSPDDARAQMDTLSADPKWVERFNAGNVEARQQFNTLTTAMASESSDRVAGLLDGTAVPPDIETLSDENPISTRDLMRSVEHLREQGLRDEVIAEVLNSRKVSPEERAAVERLQASKHGNAEWRQRLFAGDHDARREQFLMSIVLSADVQEKDR